jgi:hypothetical protein
MDASGEHQQAIYDEIRCSGVIQVIEGILSAHFFLGFIDFDAKTQEKDFILYIDHIIVPPEK